MNTTVTYRHLEITERTRPDTNPPGLPFRVLAAMTASGKFWRTTRGSLLFEPAPGEFIPLVRTPEIVGVLRDSGAIQWDGAPVPDSEWIPLAMAVNDFRYRLPCCTRYEPARAAVASHKAVRK